VALLVEVPVVQDVAERDDVRARERIVEEVAAGEREPLLEPE
jgi:hypothetical protein